jgi:hypothetical protein
MNIDEIAENIVTSFNAENDVALKKGAKYMLYKILSAQHILLSKTYNEIVFSICCKINRFL